MKNDKAELHEFLNSHSKSIKPSVRQSIWEQYPSIEALRQGVQKNRVCNINHCGPSTHNIICSILGIGSVVKVRSRVYYREIEAYRTRTAEALLPQFTPWNMELKLFCCVYALKVGGEIKYIGQAINLIRRIGDHVGLGKRFDTVDYIECPRKKLNEYEYSLIAHLMPEWNSTQERSRSLTLSRGRKE